MPGMTGSIAAVPPGVLEKCFALVVSPASVRASRFAGRSDVLDACCGRPKRCRRPQPRRERNGGGRYPAKVMTSP
jgi:hypothetical protein